MVAVGERGTVKSVNMQMSSGRSPVYLVVDLEPSHCNRRQLPVSAIAPSPVPDPRSRPTHPFPAGTSPVSLHPADRTPPPPWSTPRASQHPPRGLRTPRSVRCSRQTGSNCDRCHDRSTMFHFSPSQPWAGRTYSIRGTNGRFRQSSPSRHTTSTDTTRPVSIRIPAYFSCTTGTHFTRPHFSTKKSSIN